MPSVRHSAAAGMWCFSSHAVSWSAPSWVQSLPPVTNSGLLDAARAAARAAESTVVIPPVATGIGGCRVGGDLLADDVLGQADDNGAGPAAHRGKHGLGDDFGGALGVVQDHDALGAGVEPGFDVEFLEGFAVPVGEGDQADEQHHGGGVLPRGVQADMGVGGAGSAGDHGDAGELVHLAVGFGHVGGAALVAAHDRFDC